MSGFITDETSIISFATAGTDAGPREDVRGFSSVVAASADGRDSVLNEGVRGIGSIVTVGTVETVCVLHVGVSGCVKGFSLVRTAREKRLKRSESLLVELWIVIVSLFCQPVVAPPDESSGCPAPAEAPFVRTLRWRGR